MKQNGSYIETYLFRFSHGSDVIHNPHKIRILLLQQLRLQFHIPNIVEAFGISFLLSFEFYLCLLAFSDNYSNNPLIYPIIHIFHPSELP